MHLSMMNAFALSATLVGAVVTTAALHRPEPPPQPPAPVPATKVTPPDEGGVARATTLLGTPVVDASGGRLARVQDVLVEPSGDVVVIAERLDGALVGVPLSELKARTERRPSESSEPASAVTALRLRSDPERLVSATVFARQALDSLDRVALDGVRRHWAGQEPEPRAAGRDAAPRPLCLGHARGDRVKNPAGETLGQVEDVVLDLRSSEAAYVLVAFGGTLGVGATTHGVAPGALTRASDHAFVVEADRKTLDNSPGIDLDRLPSRPSLQVPAKASLTDGSYAHRTPR